MVVVRSYNFGKINIHGFVYSVNVKYLQLAN
jgi:hypothetical protein